MKLFGTNGIRGISNEFLNCNNSMRIGMCIASVFGLGTIAIAMDPRTSSDMIMSSVSAGIMSMGCDINNLGMIPTPALQYYVKTHDDIVGGVMITASHNPPEYNGIKCISKDGTECSHAEESSIEDEFDKELRPVTWDKIGKETKVTDAGDEYVDSVVSKADVTLIKNSKLKVCIDCSNGAGSFTTPAILKKIGVEIEAINSIPDGMFPGHPSEPLEINLGELKKRVIETGADLGAAHDGDADRCIFITNKGKYLTGDFSLALLSKKAVQKAKGLKKAVTTVATSSMVAEAVAGAEGTTEYTAVGSPIVARKMMDDGGIVGGEDNGGVIFADHQYCRDGAMALVRMIELVAEDGPLDEQVKRLPKYSTVKYVMECDDRHKKSVLSKMKEIHKGENINTLDGLRIDYDNGWAIMRPSGTEPKFRITSESKDERIAKQRADSLRNEYEKIYGELR